MESSFCFVCVSFLPTLANKAEKFSGSSCMFLPCSDTSAVAGNELNLRIDKLKVCSYKKGCGGEEGSFTSDQVPVLVWLGRDSLNRFAVLSWAGRVGRGWDRWSRFAKVCLGICPLILRPGGRSGLCSVFVLCATVGYLLSAWMKSNTAFAWVGFSISQQKKSSSIFRNFKHVLIMAAWKLQIISLGVVSTVIMKLLFPTRLNRCLSTTLCEVSYLWRTPANSPTCTLLLKTWFSVVGDSETDSGIFGTQCHLFSLLLYLNRLNLFISGIAFVWIIPPNFTNIRWVERTFLQ